MVRDHAEVNKQALALVAKLKVKPEDNDTSRALTKQAAAKRDELAKLNGAAFDKAYVANEVAYHKTVNGALESTLIPSANNAELKEPAADRLEDFPGPPAARRARRRGRQVGRNSAMTPERIALVVSLVLGLSVSARAETIQVTIDKLVFAPAEVNAKVGDTIEWINKDALVHTATATNGDWNVDISRRSRAGSSC